MDGTEGAASPDGDSATQASGRLSTRWQKGLALGDLVAKLLVPIAIAWVGFEIKEEVARIQVGPEYVDVALRTIAQDPRAQPKGVREWAVAVLDEYAGDPLDEGLARRLVAGWSFEVPFQPLGTISVDARAGQPERQVLDGHRFDVRALSEGAGDEATLTGVSVALVLPTGETVVEERDLAVANILHIHHGPRSYLFRLERLEGSVAEFTVWKQSPGFGQNPASVPPLTTGATSGETSDE